MSCSCFQLETKFRDHTNKTMTEREEPFKCVAKFASTNLLESLRECASSGIKINHLCFSKGHYINIYMGEGSSVGGAVIYKPQGWSSVPGST